MFMDITDRPRQSGAERARAPSHEVSLFTLDYLYSGLSFPLTYLKERNIVMTRGQRRLRQGRVPRSVSV